jgi:flagellin
MKPPQDGQARGIQEGVNPMALGVLNNLSAIYAENNLNNTNASLQTVLQQLSSGSRINSGADDAAGLSLVNGLAANSAALTQSETNATEGVGLLQVADGALSQVTSLLDRAITLATEASNGTLNSSQDGAANQEYSSILSEVNNIGSTTTYNQQQVFDGTDVAIYTGDSSSEGSSVDDLNIRALSETSVGDTGGAMSYASGQNNVFVNLSTSAKNASETDSLSGASTSITVTYLTKGAGGAVTTATAPITVGAGTTYNNTAQGLIDAIDAAGLGLSATFTTAGDAGTAAVASALGNADETGILISGENVGAGANQGVVGDLFAAGGPGDTLSGTLTIGDNQITLGKPNSTDTLNDLETYINQGAYDVTATLNGSNLVLTSSNSTLTVSGTSLGDTTNPGDAVAVTNVPTPLSDMATTAGVIGTMTAAAAGTVSGTFTLNGANGVVTAAINVPALTTLAEFATLVNTADVGITAVAAGNTVTFSSTAPDSGATIAAANFAALVDTGGALTTTPSFVPPVAYYSTGVTGAVTDTSDGNGGTTATAMTTDTDGTTGIATISYSDGAGMDLSGTNLLNQTDSESALNDLNEAITDVAAQDGYIGAQINTLNSISQVMSTQQENVVSAQNAVQATDYAAATSNMSKYEILSQTGIAALAQANSVQQEVLKLLQ